MFYYLIFLGFFMQQNFLGESNNNEINYSEIFLKNLSDLEKKEKNFYLKVEFLKKNLLNGNIEKFDDIFENLDGIYFELLKFTYPLGTYNLYGDDLQLKNSNLLG